MALPTNDMVNRVFVTFKGAMKWERFLWLSIDVVKRGLFLSRAMNYERFVSFCNDPVTEQVFTIFYGVVKWEGFLFKLQSSN